MTRSFIVLLFLLFSRLLANYLIPLNDTTEARYGEIARKMLETGNWVNLLHDYGQPFWAKPPLSTWCTAFSMKLLGVNEFAARLPSLFFALGILGLVGYTVKKHSGFSAALSSVLILSGSLFFFLGSGTVMTDMALIFATTLSTVAFWHALVYQKKFWSYLFFIGLGLGLLAKGPLALVLVGLPVFFWVLVRHQWLALWRDLPWIWGSLLTLVIALPWYLLAERRTPGFLNYFIIGEHVQRFLVPGWTGDKYGMAHYAPKGMIWLFALAGLFPWSFIALKWCCTRIRGSVLWCRDQEGWLLYWTFCMLAPLVFFTFASNIIYPYVFPILPAFSLFFVALGLQVNPSFMSSRTLLILSSLAGVFFLLASLIFVLSPEQVAKTEKPLIQLWLNQHPTPGSNLVYWGARTEFSAQFYSAGLVKAAQNTQDLCRLLSNHLDNYVVLSARTASELPQSLLSQWTQAQTLVHKKERLILFHSPVLVCTAS